MSAKQSIHLANACRPELGRSCCGYREHSAVPLFDAIAFARTFFHSPKADHEKHSHEYRVLRRLSGLGYCGAMNLGKLQPVADTAAVMLVMQWRSATVDSTEPPRTPTTMACLEGRNGCIRFVVSA